ncbi:aldehyde dehydrogenase family protein [Microbacterium sp.]|uniref:aldehyde dehydrogenase family protein n=1 Tax=Microbacterium sp. TaxID=51671 RepID=UPI003A8E2090
MRSSIGGVNSDGLSAAVFTQDLATSFRFVDRLGTDQVSVNQPTSGWNVHHGLGGFNDSGSPFKQQSLEALRFFAKVKTAASRAA